MEDVKLLAIGEVMAEIRQGISEGFLLREGKV